MKWAKMAQVSLRPIDNQNIYECIALTVARDQEDFVASNVKSLAEAYVNPTLHPFGIHDASAHYEENPTMVGFTMYEIKHSVGFILRLMIDKAHQGKGYGKAAMVEVIRRLKLHPDVEIIGTSHRQENETAAKLYESLGFVDWDHESAKDDLGERYLILSP